MLSKRARNGTILLWQFPLAAVKSFESGQPFLFQKHLSSYSVENHFDHWKAALTGPFGRKRQAGRIKSRAGTKDYRSALRIAGKDIAAGPSSPEVVAGKLQKSAQPNGNTHDVEVSSSAEVRYQTGSIDPVTGVPRRGREVTTSAGVGVGVGSPQEPKPGSADAERRTLELKLCDKGLPEGDTASPVAGYIYFSLPQHKGAKYQLEYTLNGNKIILDLL